MKGQFNSCFFFVAILCSTSLSLVYSYGNAGQQHLPINHFGNSQPFPSIANLPLANGPVYGQISGYRGQNIIRPAVSPGVQNVYAAGSVPLAQYQNGLGIQYGIQQAPLVNNNFATGVRPVSVPNLSWTPNRIPTANNVPLYQQPSVQPALTSYAGNSQLQTLNSPVITNPQLVQYNSGLYLRPSATNAVQQQLLSNQFVPGTQYALQNNLRQPVAVNQFGTQTNFVRNNPTQQFVNLQSTYPNQYSSPYGYQTTNPLFLRNNNNVQVLSNPSLYNQAQLQQAQTLRLQNLQLQQSLLTQQRLTRPVGTASQLSFRPSPQLPSGAVFDESQSLTESTFLPVNGANGDAQPWTPLSEDEEVKPAPVESVPQKSSSGTKKPKGKALTTKAESEVKTSATKTSTKKATTTAAPKTSTTKKTKATTTTTKKPASSAPTEAILAETQSSQANRVVETIESPQASVADSGTLAEANTSGEAVEALGIEAAEDGSTASGSLPGDQSGSSAAEPGASDASEPLVLAAANPAFLDLLKETSSEKPNTAK